MKIARTRHAFVELGFLLRLGPFLLRLNRTEDFLPDRQSAFQQRLGFGVAALLFIEQRQVVETLCDIGMIGAEHLLSDRQRALV